MITKEDCVGIGMIRKIHGLEGHVVILTDNDLLERYSNEPVFVLLDGAPVPFFIAPEGLTVRNYRSYIVKFEDIDTSSQAEKLVGNQILMERKMIGEEPERETDFDIFDLVGFEVKDLVSGQQGKVADIADYSGNIVFSIAILGKEVLLPFSEDYIKEILFEEKIVTAFIPQEIVDLN